MSDLLQLAERCEQATGPDRRLDVQIEIVREPTKQWIVGEKPGPWPRDPIYGTLADLWKWACDESKEPPEINTPRYTASLDAAMTLVPEGWLVSDIWQRNTVEPQWIWRVRLWNPKTDVEVKSKHLNMLSLALCAAALRARATQ